MTSYAIRDVPKLTNLERTAQTAPEARPEQGVPVPVPVEEAQLAAACRQVLRRPFERHAAVRTAGERTARRRPWRRHRLQQHLRRASGYLSVRPMTACSRGAPVRHPVPPNRVPDLRRRQTAASGPGSRPIDWSTMQPKSDCQRGRLPIGKEKCSKSCCHGQAMCRTSSTGSAPETPQTRSHPHTSSGTGSFRQADAFRVSDTTGNASRIDPDAVVPPTPATTRAECQRTSSFASGTTSWNRPHFRPEQRYARTSAQEWEPFENPVLQGQDAGRQGMVWQKAAWSTWRSSDLRRDELHRIQRVQDRNDTTAGYEGEHVYMPLQRHGGHP